ncbi:MAG: phenylacetate-CoA oxygenase subunit PaaJ [Bacteroidetes bacterium]|nr:phenylacetate-CoA oxygenase subunit PaaJ [Bacteroidota bacterium]
MCHKNNEIFQLLNQIPDPEIPVISIVELGVVRDLNIISDTEIRVTITPTYSGCPAMKQMEDDVRAILHKNGFTSVEVLMKYSPAWTTDWISDDAKIKLQKYGIAPPEESTSDKSFLKGLPKIITCPKCKSKNTKMISQFGSTACKALYRCNECLEPFDYFKCI